MYPTVTIIARTTIFNGEYELPVEERYISDGTSSNNWENRMIVEPCMMNAGMVLPDRGGTQWKKRRCTA